MSSARIPPTNAIETVPRIMGLDGGAQRDQQQHEDAEQRSRNRHRQRA
jgi:hypothetical protein